MAEIARFDARSRGNKKKSLTGDNVRGGKSKERLSPQKAQLTSALGVLALVTCAWVADKGEPSGDECTGAMKQLVQVGSITARPFSEGKPLEIKNGVRGVLDAVGVINDSRSLSGVASQMSKDRGYHIPVERLITSNNTQKFVQRNEEGEIVDNMPSDANGFYCVNVPGPIYGGYDLVRNEATSLASIAETQLIDISVLKQLNPEYKNFKDSDLLAEGTVVKVDATVDTGMVIREMSDGEQYINHMAGSDKKLQEKLIMANRHIFGQGGSLKSGDVGVLPFAKTEYLEAHKLSHPQIVAAFSKVAVKQVVDLKGIEKPNTAKKAEVATPKAPEIFNEEGPAVDAAFAAHVTRLAASSDKAMDGATLAVIINKYDKQYDSGVISRNLIAAQIWQESRFNPNARSPVGALGLSQFMPGTWPSYGKGDPRNPDAAVNAQYKMMTRLYDVMKERFPRKSHNELLGLTLAGYNAGPNNGAVVEGRVPKNGETDKYVAIIMEHVARMDREQAAAAQKARDIKAGLTPANFNGSLARSREAPRTPIQAVLSNLGTNGGTVGKYMVEIPSKYEYGPESLFPQALEDFMAMSDAYYKQTGTRLLVNDGYRTLAGQVDSKAGATEKGRPAYAATPGTSKHGWGLAADVLMDGAKGFSDPRYIWMSKNAINYGWVQYASHQANGVIPEPWHWEYNRTLKPNYEAKYFK